ncbi:pumilio 8 [Euphorbia peplus]|nr:pumilio 8 [Euphorbia peplus]
MFELMLKPFGDYVIQKFLDVCDEKQRLQIVLMVTEEPGQLARICLNTYGTRADQNGNHVIERCLQCLSNEDNKTVYALLKSKSEQERRLLVGLVNKLGDP